MIALQADPVAFALKLVELRIIPVSNTNRKDVRRLQRGIQMSGNPEAIREILNNLFAQLREELKGQWNEIKKIKLPKEFKGLPRAMINDMKRLFYYMQHVLAKKLNVSPENMVSVINIPAGNFIEREA
jgi:hypothetical protein